MGKFYVYIDDRSCPEPMIGPFDTRGEAEQKLFEHFAEGYNAANLIILEEVFEEGED